MKKKSLFIKKNTQIKARVQKPSPTDLWPKSAKIDTLFYD